MHFGISMISFDIKVLNYGHPQIFMDIHNRNFEYTNILNKFLIGTPYVRPVYMMEYMQY